MIVRRRQDDAARFHDALPQTLNAGRILGSSCVFAGAEWKVVIAQIHEFRGCALFFRTGESDRSKQLLSSCRVGGCHKVRRHEPHPMSVTGQYLCQ